VSHGASRLDLRLPRPSGVGRGVTDLTFDEQEFGAVGGRLRLASRQAAAAAGGYEIEIAGGAAHVQVTTEEQPSNQEVVTP
jgi:hypothetical protein